MYNIYVYILFSRNTLKTIFVKVTNSKSWEDAQKEFTKFANEDRLHQFTSLTWTNDVPQIFTTYCQGAVDSKKDNPSSPNVHCLKHENGCTTTLIRCDWKGVTQKMVTASCPGCGGGVGPFDCEISRLSVAFTSDYFKVSYLVYMFKCRI